MEPETSAPRVPIRELARYFLRLGLIGFGGPVALVGQMERELVGERKWLTKEEMREGIAVCQSLPGPLAIQVGIWISYIRGGFWGAWAGGWAFILPNFVIVTVLGALYIHFGGLSAVQAVFYGVSPAVIALILHSCYRLTKLGMKDGLEWVLAAAAFVITVTLKAEVALLFIGCGILGVLYLWLALSKADHVVDHDLTPCRPPARRRRLRHHRPHARQALHLLPEGRVLDLWQRARHRALSREGPRAANGLAQ
jgi:chromate transporter